MGEDPLSCARGIEPFGSQVVGGQSPDGAFGMLSRESQGLEDPVKSATEAELRSQHSVRCDIGCDERCLLQDAGTYEPEHLEAPTVGEQKFFEAFVGLSRSQHGRFGTEIPYEVARTVNYSCQRIAQDHRGVLVKHRNAAGKELCAIKSS